MMEITKQELRAALREDLAGRGWVRATGAIDGPLPDSFPDVLHGNYRIVEPDWIRFVVLPYVHRFIDTLPRVSGDGRGVYSCADFVETAVGLVRAYLVDGQGGSILPCDYFGINYRLACGLVAGGHSMVVFYTTSGAYYWDPEIHGGGRFEPPLPKDVRHGQWGLHTGRF